MSYTNCKVIGNGSFGVVFQAKLVNAPKDQEDIAIKKVLQDKRFKVSEEPCFSAVWAEILGAQGGKELNMELGFISFVSRIESSKL